MITEGELIEIAQRRRKLEDAIEALHPDTELIAVDEFIGEGDGLSPKSYIEELAEFCRDDMNRMAEEIRRSAETGG